MPKPEPNHQTCLQPHMLNFFSGTLYSRKNENERERVSEKEISPLQVVNRSGAVLSKNQRKVESLKSV